MNRNPNPATTVRAAAPPVVAAADATAGTAETAAGRPVATARPAGNHYNKQTNMNGTAPGAQTPGRFPLLFMECGGLPPLLGYVECPLIS